MPPKRGKKAAAAAPPAAPPLENCTIVLSGTFPKPHTQAALKAKAEALGAAVASAVSKDTTHLIATDADYLKNSAKVTKSKALGIHIVSIEWLATCEEDNAKAPEKDFVPGAADDDEEDTQPDPSQSIPIRTNGAAKGRKRTLSPTPDVSANDSARKAKRARVKKAGVKAEDDDEAKAEDSQDTKPLKTRGRKTTAQPDDDGKDDEEGVKPKKNGHKAAKTDDAAGDEEDTKPATSKPAPVVGAGQVAKRKDVQIPLDEGCPYATSAVYIGPDGVIYDASLNQTNARNNNNKFYRIQLLVDPNGRYRTWTRWGRVGERGQTAAVGEGSLEDAMGQFMKKFKDKSGLTWDQRGEAPRLGKYAFIERNYSAESEDEDEPETNVAKGKKPSDYVPPKCTLHPAVQKLMELIFNQQFFNAAMTALNYDANKMPLGKLSKATITRGFQALKDLSALLDDQTLASNYGRPFQQAVEDLSNSFYSVIPHAFGRDRPPIISSQQMVKREIELLESLSDMKDAALIMKMEKVGNDDVHPVDKQYQGLNMEEMTPLDPTSTEYTHLHEYLVKTHGATHSVRYNVDAIFRIERQGEKDQFDQSYAKNAKNRRLLWHGSRTTNFGGILSQGLRIAPPEAPVSGYMFGKGIYLADMSSKSANYCYSGMSNNIGLLLLCEAELGDPMQELIHASYNAGDTAKSKGMLSTWGQGRIGPTKWKDAKCVHPSLEGVSMPDTSVIPGDTNVPGAGLMYNEYICYDVAQVRLRYLFRVQM